MVLFRHSPQNEDDGARDSINLLHCESESCVGIVRSRHRPERRPKVGGKKEVSKLGKTLVRGRFGRRKKSSSSKSESCFIRKPKRRHQSIILFGDRTRLLSEVGLP